jgi:hypothetical protein
MQAGCNQKVFSFLVPIKTPTQIHTNELIFFPSLNYWARVFGQEKEIFTKIRRTCCKKKIQVVRMVFNIFIL